MTDELRRIAEAATPGPWVNGQHPAAGGFIVKPILFGSRIKNARTFANDRRVLPANEGGHVLLKSEADADYLATFHPARIKLLLDVVEAAKAYRLAEDDYRGGWMQGRLSTQPLHA
jgi:hypothetical protein